MSDPVSSARLPDWEAFYANYRKPGYVPGFEITTKLGGGMFGLVFKATRQSIGKDYAIKFLKVDDGEVRGAVLQELEQVRYFAQVDHPNLVAIEDRGEVDGIPYLVMAYAGAETLKDRLPGTPEDRDENLRCFLQACRGVAALHEKSLVHFDLKPGNVFLKGGVARVGDYGLSKLVTHSRGSLSMGRGTPYYMAPELLQRRGDHRSDVYSLGVMLYEVLTGELPFRGDSEWEVLKKHETAQVAFPAHVGPRERAVVERCLAKDPAQRFQSVHDLIAVLGGPAGTVPASVVDGAPAATMLADDAPAADRPARVDAAEFVRSAWPPPPKKRRGALRAVIVMLVMVMAFSLFLQDKVASATRTRGRTRVLEPVALATEPGAETPTRRMRDEIRRVAAAIEQAARKATRELPSPAKLDPRRIALPIDLPLYVDEIQRLATVEFSPGLAARLERHGYPIFLAAIGWLQERDYRNSQSCQQAANVLQFLQETTAVSGLAVAAPRGKPDPATVRRFVAAANGWRRLAEGCCADEGAFQAFLQATGKRCPEERDR